MDTSQVVLPGDIVRRLPANASVKLGPGVHQLPAAAVKAEGSDRPTVDIAATRSGILGVQQLAGKPGAVGEGGSQSCWVESSTKRYIPAQSEPVIGVIVARHAEGYRVDIGAAQMAALDGLAFEDATKRNKPNLKVGAVVYARVSLALPFCEPEIECFDPKTGKSQGFGELTGGMLIRNLELGKCRALLSPSHPLLPSLGRKFPFELAIGVNGRVWVKASEIQRTVELVKTISDA